MKVELKDGELVVRIPAHEPFPSSTGKTLTVATTHGAITTDMQIEGENLIVNLNAYIPNYHNDAPRLRELAAKIIGQAERIEAVNAAKAK